VEGREVVAVEDRREWVCSRVRSGWLPDRSLEWEKRWEGAGGSLGGREHRLGDWHARHGEGRGPRKGPGKEALRRGPRVPEKRGREFRGEEKTSGES